MTPTEAVALVNYIAAGCPSMRMAEGTPDVWYDGGLAEIPTDVATEAARSLVRRLRYVGLNDIVGEAEAIRKARAGAVRRAELEAAGERPGPVIEREGGGPVPGSDEHKIEERRRIMADAYAKSKVIRSVPRVDPRPDGVRMVEARAEVERARELAREIETA